MLATLTIALVFTGAAIPRADLFVDSGAICSAGTGSQANPYCTIGEALSVAINGDVIHIVPGVYLEELSISSDVILEAIAGPGHVVVDGEGTRNLLTVESGVTATVDGLWFQDGSASGASGNGSVFNRGGLTLRNSTITNTHMSGCCSRAIVYDQSGSMGLVLDGCTVRNNSINGSGASLIKSYGSAGLTIRGSSVVNNYVYVGATVKAGFAPVIIEGSFFRSTSPQSGPVIRAREADLTLRNTTITGTRTGALRVRGGGGYQLIENCTLLNVGALVGASIYVDGTAVPRVRSSVLGTGTLPPVQGAASVRGAFVSLGYNVVEVATSTSSGFVDGVMGDQVGSPSQPLDAMMFPTTNNGSPLHSHLPMPGSPAIDRGHPTVFPDLDQNGFPRAAGGTEVGAAELTVGLPIVCASAFNSTGDIARLRISGSSDLSRNAVELFVDRAPSGMTGMFLTSNTQGFVPNPGGSTGSLCLGGSIGRFVGPGQLQTSSPEGTLRLSVDLAAIPRGVGTVAATAGQSWLFQSWFRDNVAGIATSNFSTAQSMAF